MKNMLNRLTVEFTLKKGGDRNIKHQFKLTSNCIHKSYAKCDSYIFKQNEVLMDKPIYLGFAIIELGK